ncbi:MAG: site-specific DNA-methyltransferase [Thaumarchaeota archaeon]|nr:site-specific DNA-methyltransferase [Nitrososphaerota archaeon]
MPLRGAHSAVACSSALNIPLASGSVGLTVTSPPYHNAIDYEKHLEKEWYRGNAGKSLQGYLSQMFDAFSEVHRVTKDSGFCAIVIGNEISDGTLIPLPHLLVEKLCSTHGRWNFHEEIIWNKVTGGLDRFGVTIQRPFPTYYRANVMHELILILRKGDLVHKKDEKSRFHVDEVMKKDTSNSIWNVAPVPPRYIDHPCPFPEEIPLRLISLYSNKGDLVLDPFLGSGQTGKAAKHLGRRFFGSDVLMSYCRLSSRRIASEKLHVRPQLVAKWERVEVR